MKKALGGGSGESGGRAIFFPVRDGLRTQKWEIRISVSPENRVKRSPAYPLPRGHSEAGELHFFSHNTIQSWYNKVTIDERKKAMGVIISIINQKGGVGKTTTAVNLAAYLADRGKKTLLIDEDAQGNSTSGLSKDVELKKNLYDVLLDDADAEEAIVKTAVKKLSLLPSSIDLAGADIELSAMDGREHILKKKIEALKDAYDFILIDCPPSLGLMTLNALVASDSILIPIQAEFYALEGLSQLVKTVQIVSRKLNPSLRILGILLTMFDGRTNLSLQVAEEVKTYFGSKVFKTVIPRTVKLSEAPSFGEPILTYAPKSKGAEAYKKLCREVLKRG